LQYCTLPRKQREALIAKLTREGYKLTNGGSAHDNVFIEGENKNIWAKGRTLTWREPEYSLNVNV